MLHLPGYLFLLLSIISPAPKIKAEELRAPVPKGIHLQVEVLINESLEY